MKEKVLIVGDKVEYLEYIKSLVGPENEVEAEFAESELDAVDLAGSNKYDIIILDTPLHYLDVLETVNLIRENSLNNDTCMILLADQDSSFAGRKEEFQLKSVDTLSKPFQNEDVKRLFNLHLHYARREKELAKSLNEANQRLNNEINLREKAEKLLERIQENFKNIVGKSKAAILILDNEGILKFINPAGEEIFQRSADEIVGKPFGLVADLEKKSEITILRKDRQIGIGEISATRTYWENEAAWLVLINDITDHKNLQQHLVKAKEDAQKADRLKTAFLSNMSHEIRTPMNGIVGFVDILEKDPDLTEEDKGKFLSIIKNSSNHLLSLVNDIIDISKIEAGQLVINLKNCNIAELIIELYEFFSSNVKIKENNIDLSFEIPIGENQEVSTDYDRLRQVLMNLIGNSIKYTESGFIKFGYRIENNAKLVFYVKDSGSGIPKDYHEKIFDRFVQVIDEKKAYMSGTGLGLAISKSLVELLGGNIWIESEEKKGTTFYFSIPLIRKSNESLSGKDHNKKTNNAALTNFNKTILIAEDIPTNFILLDNILRKKGSKTIWAKTGNEAVALCKDNSVSLVLMDMKMPEMDGYQATQEIRKFNKNIPIIAQTAYALEGESEKSIEAGCNEYLTKPIDQMQLIAVLEKYLK